MTFSLRRSSFWLRPVPTLEIKTSSILTLTYSTGVPPTLRTVSSARVGGALATAQHQFGRAAVHEFANRDVLDVDFAPAGTLRPKWAEPLFVIPHDQERTSISLVCTLSLDSPVTPSSLRNVSTAISY